MSFVQAANAAFVYIHSVVRSILQLCFLNPDTSDTWMLDKPWYTNFIEPRNHQVFYFHDAIILLKLKNFYLNLVVKSHIYILVGGFKHFPQYMGCHPSHWLSYFFKMVKTTNQFPNM